MKDDEVSPWLACVGWAVVVVMGIAVALLAIAVVPASSLLPLWHPYNHSPE